MKKMEKGFTLIELLAVIAIISILVIIAVPSVLKLFEAAKINSFKIEAQNVVKAAESGYASRLFKGNIETTTYLYTNGETNKTGNVDIQLSGLKIKNGKINISKEGSISLAISDGKYCAIKARNSKEIIISENLENCFLKELSATWVKNYGGSYPGFFNDITAVEDGFVAVGEMGGYAAPIKYDSIIVKYNFNGIEGWKKTFGGAETDHFYGVAATADGNIIAVGNSNSTDGDLTGLNIEGTDCIIVKYDSIGTMLWKRKFGGTSYDYFKAVKITPEGDILAAGIANSQSVIVKYNQNGEVIKTYYYGEIFGFFNSLAITPDGYVAAGLSADSKALIVKFDFDGTLLWDRKYGRAAGSSGRDEFRGIELTSDGNLVAVGKSKATDGDLTGLNKGDDDAIIVKYDQNGNMLWKKNFGGLYWDEFNGVEIDQSGNILVVGISNSEDQNLASLRGPTPDYDEFAIVVKYNSLGKVIDKSIYGGTEPDYFYGVAPTSNGFVAIGWSLSTNGDLTGLNINTSNGDAVIFAIKE